MSDKFRPPLDSLGAPASVASRRSLEIFAGLGSMTLTTSLVLEGLIAAKFVWTSAGNATYTRRWPTYFLRPQMYTIICGIRERFLMQFNGTMITLTSGVRVIARRHSVGS